MDMDDDVTTVSDFVVWCVSLSLDPRRGSYGAITTGNDFLKTRQVQCL